MALQARATAALAGSEMRNKHTNREKPAGKGILEHRWRDFPKPWEGKGGMFG